MWAARSERFSSPFIRVHYDFSLPFLLETHKESALQLQPSTRLLFHLNTHTKRWCRLIKEAHMLWKQKLSASNAMPIGHKQLRCQGDGGQAFMEGWSLTASDTLWTDVMKEGFSNISFFLCVLARRDCVTWLLFKGKIKEGQQEALGEPKNVIKCAENGVWREAEACSVAEVT